MGKFYLTTAIDYSDGDPHHGHAFEKIGADAIARYRRLCGDDVHFLKHSLAHYRADGAPSVDFAPVTITRSPPRSRVYGGAGVKAEMS